MSRRERSHNTNSEKHKENSCKTCEKPFFPSLRQVDRLEKESVPLPDTCPKCKGRMCDNYSTNGECAYGDSCKLLHPAEFGKVPNPSRSGWFGGLGELRCRFATSGRCAKGKDCKFSHEHAKTPAALAIVPFSRHETVHMAAVSSDVWTQEMEKVLERGMSNFGSSWGLLVSFFLVGKEV